MFWAMNLLGGSYLANKNRIWSEKELWERSIVPWMTLLGSLHATQTYISQALKSKLGFGTQDSEEETEAITSKDTYSFSSQFVENKGFSDQSLTVFQNLRQRCLANTLSQIGICVHYSRALLKSI